MSNPIMMVRKIKNSSIKSNSISEGKKPIKLIVPEEYKPGMSRTIGMPPNKINLNKSRSSSSLKKYLNPNLSTNITPLSKKLRNMSQFIGSTPDIQENLNESVSNDDSRQKFLKNLETWLSDQKKICNKIEIYIETLRKLPAYDPFLKRIIDEVTLGIQFHFRQNREKSSEIYECDEIEEVKKTLAETIHEKNKLKRDVDVMNNVLKFFRNKKDVPVEIYIQEFKENERMNRKKNVKGESINRVQSVPKLVIGHSGDIGFHQEFMAKANEFSDSWRELIKNEKNQ